MRTGIERRFNYSRINCTLIRRSREETSNDRQKYFFKIPLWIDDDHVNDNSILFVYCIVLSFLFFFSLSIRNE